MLNYALYNNELTADDPDDQVARPVNVITNTEDQLVTEATGPGSILKPTETKAVIDNYWQTIARFTAKGETYSDAYISTRFDISGVFTNADDRFDPNRHSLQLSIRLKPTVTEALDQVTLKHVDARQVEPVIDQVYDWGSDTDNTTLTPGKVLEISGNTLKIYNNLPEEGVFFINQTDSTETKAVQIRTNEPKTLTLQIPALVAGTYRIAVRNTGYSGKTLKVGLFLPLLEVS